jgi:hypothetical protein
MLGPQHAKHFWGVNIMGAAFKENQLPVTRADELKYNKDPSYASLSLSDRVDFISNKKKNAGLPMSDSDKNTYLGRGRSSLLGG